MLTRDENNRKLIPIRPICDALGIDEDVQNRKLKEDDFLSSVPYHLNLIFANILLNSLLQFYMYLYIK